MTAATTPVFEVRDLTVDFDTSEGSFRAVDAVSFAVHAGQTLGLVGESGAGKSVSVKAALRLLDEPPARITGGEALLDGADLLEMTSRQLRRIRGRDIGLVLQDPLTSLHPSLRIGDQIAEAIHLHDTKISRRAARARAVELLDLVGIPQAHRRWRDHPHEWSGGMRQRAVIAIAIANGPKLLVADEPTTALDVTIQAQVLGVLREIQEATGTAMILITHDLGVIAELADVVTVLHDARVVESGPAIEVFRAPKLPYTASLLARRSAIARRGPDPVAREREVVLDVEDLVTHLPSRGGGRGAVVHAVDGLSFSLRAGETLGLVGESGCGKSTLARSVVRLLQPTSGSITFEGQDITTVAGADLRAVHARLRIVFQDPFASLNPRRTVGDIVAEPLRIQGRHRNGVRERVAELFELVGLDHDLLVRYPHQLSGGQRQRVGIARALALEPRVLVLDEPVSSLDVPIQAQVLELLGRLQRELGLAYLFVSHDLGVVRQLSHRLAVMYLGKIVEIGPAATVCDRPAHPYTRALLSAVPIDDPSERDSKRRIILVGEPPDPTRPPTGCRFSTRCWLAFDRCRTEEPELEVVDGRSCACHLVVDASSTAATALEL